MSRAHRRGAWLDGALEWCSDVHGLIPMKPGHNRSRFRSATAVDLESVAAWIQGKRECELWAGWRVAFPIDLQALPANIGFAESNAFSLTIDEELIAFGQLIAKASRRGHLARLIVNPLCRGKGYGETLIRALLDEARRASFERVSLNVDVGNVAAVSLYRKLGFVDSTRPPEEPEAAASRYMEMRI